MADLLEGQDAPPPVQSTSGGAGAGPGSTFAHARGLTIAAWTLAAITVTMGLGCTLAEILGPGPAPTSADPDAGAGGAVLVGIQSLMAAAFACLGAVVVKRQPRNPIGWLMVTIGFFFMSIALSNELYLQVVLSSAGSNDSAAIVRYVVWAGNWDWVFALIPALTFLPLLFPTGRPPTSRWRAVGWIAGAAMALSFISSAFKAGPLDGAPAVDNPLGIRSPAIGALGGLGFLCVLAALVGSITSLVLRFRRSSGIEREQIKWVASSALLLPLAATGLGLGTNASWPLLLLALLVVAVAVTIAMLRYRLFDIDVVINRALVYGSLTAILAAVYVGTVLLLQLLLRGLTEGSGLTVAGSTLATAALVRPGRARIQAIVDRRFFRRRYDAKLVVQSFGAKLRDDIDLTALGDDLIQAVHTTVQPKHASLWLNTRRTRD